MHIMSGVMKPLQTLLGVISSRSVAEAHADVAVVRRRVAARVHRRPTSTMSARSCDSVVMPSGLGGSGRRRTSPVLSRQSAEQKNSAREPHDSATARSGTTNVPQTGSRTICTPCCGNAAAARVPSRRRSGRERRRPQARSAPDRSEQDRQEDEAKHQAPGLRRAAASGMRGLKAVEGPLGGLTLGAVGREMDDLLPRLLAPVEILLAERPDDAEFSSVFACFGSIFSESSNCWSALSG